MWVVGSGGRMEKFLLISYPFIWQQFRNAPLSFSVTNPPVVFLSLTFKASQVSVCVSVLCFSVPVD